MLYRLFLSCLALLAFQSLSIHKANAYSDEISSRSEFFQAYKPIYFIVGKNAKIELSFKSQIIGDTPIYFGYTQAMIWQVFANIPYFSDINYNPELFYRFKLGNVQAHSLDVIIFNHESNGEGSVSEKSWNRSGLKYQWVTEFHDYAKIYWSLSAWLPYLYAKYNPDIIKYRGLGELTITLTQFIGKGWDQNDLTLRLFLGGSSRINPLEGGQEITVRLKAHDRAFLPLFVAQVFHGYGETMNTMTEDVLGFRAGIGF